MMADVEIEECLKNRSLIIRPFDESSLGGAGYDLRLDEAAVIPPSQSKLVATLERVELNDSLAGTLHLRSTLARAGVIASLALVDPGFRGQLTILLFNCGSRELRMEGGERFVQIALHRLGVKARRPYAGRYQDSQGIVDSRG